MQLLSPGGPCIVSCTLAEGALLAKHVPVLRLDCCSVRQACNRPRNTVRCHHNNSYHLSRVAAIGKAYDKRTIILEHDRAFTETWTLRQPLRLGLRHTAALRARGTLTEAIEIHPTRDPGLTFLLFSHLPHAGRLSRASTAIVTLVHSALRQR